MASSDRHFKPTAQRIEQARSKGNVPRTQQLGPALAFLGVATAAGAAGATPWMRPFADLERRIVALPAADLGVEDVWGLFHDGLVAWAPLAGTLLGTVIAASLLSIILQGGAQPTSEPLKLDVNRFNPVSKLKNLFSFKHGWDTARSFLAAITAIWIVTASLRTALPELNALSFVTGATLGAELGGLFVDIAWRAGLGLAILGGLDLAMSHFIHQHQLKMSREDIKQEMKEQEGSPEVKGKRRQRMLEMIRSRSLSAVRRAEVVVTNPTHYAVALSYKRPLMRAPRVVAKGRNRMAHKIRLEAIKHGVPVVENPELARELYRKVKVDHEIPPDLFMAVAQVIAFVLKLRHSLDGQALPEIAETG